MEPEAPGERRAAPRLEVVGVGRPRDRRRSWTTRRWRCCGSGSASCEPSPLTAELEEVELPAAEPLPRALVDAVGAEATSSPATEDRVRHADRPRLRRPGAPARAAGSRRRRTPSCSRPTPTAVRRVLEVCAGEGVAVVPFGGGTSVVGGVEPLRGAHSRLISLDLGAPARRRGRPPLADRAARRRPARAGGGGGARRARGSRSATSRSPSSTRRSAASPRPARPARPRAATGASTLSSPRSGCSPRPARCGPCETPHTAAGPALRELVVGSEGALGRDPRRHRAGAPGAARCAATRPGSPRASRPAPRSSARWPRAAGCPT